MSATTAEARLFWQTYGSTIPNGAGSSWNWNQDYFIPRYSSSGRYGLFSPCKTSRTTSPACKRSHPFYPGYCSIYGPLHYGWRNHVYGAYCGSTPVEAYQGPWRASRGQGCAEQTLGCTAATCPSGGFVGSAPTVVVDYLPNVESSGLEILGSISVEGDGLLTNIDLPPTDAPNNQRSLLGPQSVDPNINLPALLMQQLEKTTQPLPSP